MSPIRWLLYLISFVAYVFYVVPLAHKMILALCTTFRSIGCPVLSKVEREIRRKCIIYLKNQYIESFTNDSAALIDA